MIQRLARLMGIELEVCVQAVEEVVAFYRPGHYTIGQIVDLIACYKIAGEEERSVLHQFREEVARLQA